jgi:hypothetical protein
VFLLLPVVVIDGDDYYDYFASVTQYMIYLNVVLLISEILYKEQAYAVPTGLLSFLKVKMVFTFIHMYSFMLIKGSQLNSILNKEFIKNQ